MQSKGFVPVAQENGMLIAYATAEGELASDVGSNAGPYAKTLAEEIVKPGVEAVVMFRAVQRRVRAAISQEPYLGFNALGDVYFAGKPEAATVASEAAQAWAAVKDTHSTDVLASFAERYKDTIYAELARVRRRDLEAQQKNALLALEVQTKALERAEKQRQEEEDRKKAEELKSTADRRYVVQLSSQRTRAEAIASVSALQKKYSTVLADKVLGIQEANLGSKGIVHRGLIGPPMSTDAANRICSDLKAAGGQCFITSITDVAFIALTSAELQAPCDGVETLAGGELRCLKPKDAFRDCPDCPEMVVVPAGIFTMGSPANELERSNDEGQVRVSIAAPFAVGRFAVTFDEWDACVVDGGCNGYKPADQGWGHGKRPVINVSWDDAKAYTAWVSRKTGKIYRLLSESEREYVTRAGTTTPFWWGSSINPIQANYNATYTYAGGGSKGEYRQRTLPVDSLEPNPWGLYNVHGNVWEWTEDCWHDSNTGNPADGRPRTIVTCGQHVVRGGSWSVNPEFLRSAFRFRGNASSRYFIFGFRVARTLNP